MRMCVWNSLRVWISYRSFRQKWNFISGDKISCKHYQKWNFYTCPSKYRVVLKCRWNETSCEQDLTGVSSFRLSCERTLSVAFTSGSVNHKSHDNFFYIFHVRQAFLWLWRVAFWNFQKITIKKQRDGVYILFKSKFQELRRFGGNF